MPARCRGFFECGIRVVVTTGEDTDLDIPCSKKNPHRCFKSGFVNRGHAYTAKKDYGHAIVDYSEAIRLDPKYTNTFYLRARAYFLKKDYEHAFAGYSEVIRIDPTAAAYVTRGNAYAAKDDYYDHAIADYRAAITLDPSFVEAFYRRADAHLKLQDYDAAIADYTGALRLEPENADAHGRLGAVLLYQGKTEEAVAEFRRAVNLGAKNYCFSLGKALFDQGKATEAATEFHEAVEIMRDDSYAMLWLYLARARSGGEDAKAELAANEKNLKKRDWPYPLVELFLDRRKPKAALDAATKGDDRCEAQFYVGEWRLLRGDRRAGMMNLKAAVDTCPKSFGENSRPELESARAELKPLQQ